MVRKPLRVAHLGSKGIPGSGGTERVVEAVAVRQAATGTITVYGSSRMCRSGRYRNVGVVAIPTPRHKFLGPVALQLMAALHALSRGRYDIVHVHGTENGFVVPLLRLRFGVVLTSHGMAYRLDKWPLAAKALMRVMELVGVTTASGVTAVAAAQADILTSRYGRRVVAIPNGADTGVKCDLEAARVLLCENGVADGPFLLFVAARIDPAKGCHTLLDAYAALEGPPPLVVVGDLSQASGYEERVRRAAESKQVHFLPPVSDHDTLLGLVASAEICVFPSTTEAMSMMLLEAMSAGAVVLTSDIREMRSVLPPGHPVFRAGDAEDLRRALVSGLEQSQEERARLGNHVRDWVESRYSWGRAVAGYTSLYEQVLSRGPAQTQRRRSGYNEPRK